jgi:alpha-galactosidase/6-phospho-beta-glucosidase family protein
MAPRVVVIGGGSYQWVPKLLIDVVNTRSLADAQIVLHDIDPVPLEPMAAFVAHLAELANVRLTVSTTTNRREALHGADFVIVTISTGGFASMRHDLEIPERYGIRQSVGDTVGPGGVVRALRNIPVLVDIARDMEALCPDAWLLNITNPMATLCRAVTRETTINCVGLCHEVAMAQFTLAQLLDVSYTDFELDVVGVNHLPLITGMRVAGRDGLELVREVLADADRCGDEPVAMPEGFGHEATSFGGSFKKRDLLRGNQVKFALFERFGVLPAAGDRHLVEFFPGFLTEESSWGKRWGVDLTTIADREVWVEYYKAEFAKLASATAVPRMPSGEIVAPLIDSMLRDRPRRFPFNLPNTGQAPDLPADVVVETMGTVDGQGVRGDGATRAPAVLAEWLRRVVSSQERTVVAGLTGSRSAVVEAMLLDPLAGRMDFDRLQHMTDEMTTATAEWLPQFA